MAITVIDTIEPKAPGFKVVDTTNVSHKVGESLDACLDEMKSISDIHKNDVGNVGREIYNGGVVTFIDDDGHIDFYNKFVPIFKKHNVTCSFAVVASRAEQPIGTTTSGDPYEAMSWAQIRELIDAGFDCQSHTYSHDKDVFRANAVNYNEAGLDFEFGEADKLFAKNGITYNAIVYPWGTAEQLKRTVASRYVKYGLALGDSNDTNSGITTEITDPYNIDRFYTSNWTASVDKLKTMIDTAKNTNAWLIICTHVNATQPSADALDTILTYCETVGIRIETFTNAVKLKAPAYFAGNESSMFRVLNDGTTRMTGLDDESIAKIFDRASELGYLNKTKLAITATYSKTDCLVGDTVDKSLFVVVLEYSNHEKETITDFTISETDLVLKEGDNVFTIVHGSLTCNVTIVAYASSGDVLAITTQPQDTTADVCTSVSFTVEATGDGLTYQWKYRKSASDPTWVDSTSDTAHVLTVDALVIRNGRQYKCVVSDIHGGSVESNVATLTVNNPAATKYYDFGQKVAYVPLEELNDNSTVLMTVEGFSYPTKTDVAGTHMISGKAPNDTSGTGGAVVMLNTTKWDSFYLCMNNTPATAVTNASRYSRVLNAMPSTLATMPHTLLLTKGTLLSSYTDISNFDAIAVNGTLQKNSGYLYINTSDSKTAVANNPEHYTTAQELADAITAGEQYYNYDTLKISVLKVWKDTKYTTIAEAMASTVQPDINIQVGDDGLPYNAGTSGALVCSL